MHSSGGWGNGDWTMAECAVGGSGWAEDEVCWFADDGIRVVVFCTIFWLGIRTQNFHFLKDS